MSKLNMKKVAVILAACCLLIAPATLASPPIKTNRICYDQQISHVLKPGVYALVFSRGQVCPKKRRGVLV